MFGSESAENLHFSITAAQLDDFAKQYPDVKLIIIDTLQRVRNLNRE